MAAPEFWIVAGPNGAGKTTCVQKEPIARILPGVTFLNPDDRTLSKLHHLGYRGFRDAPPEIQHRLFIESANEVQRDLEFRIEAGSPVGVETVLSSEKYCPIVERVRAARGFVGLIYVALSSPQLAVDRVAERVRKGGHGVPPSKIESRWFRSLTNLKWFARHATAFWVFDNSDSNSANMPVLIAQGQSGSLIRIDKQAFAEIKETLSKLA